MSLEATKPGTSWVAGAIAVVGVASGCVAPARATLNQLRVRAAFDLGCSPAMLHLSYLDERTKAVTGCGRQLIYVETCEQVGSSTLCTWVLDRPDRTAAAGPPPVGGAGWYGAATPRSLPGPAVGLVCTPVTMAMPNAPASAAPPPAPASSVVPVAGTGTTAPPLPAEPPPADPFEDRH